jgi:hypothetical protein
VAPALALALALALPLLPAAAAPVALALLPAAAAPVALALLPVSSSCYWQRVAPVALVLEQDPDQAQQRFQGASGPSPVFEGPVWFLDLCMHPLARSNASQARHDGIPAVRTVACI